MKNTVHMLALHVRLEVTLFLPKACLQLKMTADGRTQPPGPSLGWSNSKSRGSFLARADHLSNSATTNLERHCIKYYICLLAVNEIYVFLFMHRLLLCRQLRHVFFSPADF